jgi:branched-chain amino acid transport system permease protein
VIRVVAVFALAAIAPMLVGWDVAVLHYAVLATAYAVMALGLNVIVGFAGLLDLGYVAFFAIGAYTAAYFASGYRDIHLNVVLVLALAVVTTGIAGALIGVPTLRLRGDYIAIVTLAFGEIIGQVAVNGQRITLFGGTLTLGPIGIGPIDRIDLPGLGRFDAVDLRPWYWFGLALIALALIVNLRLRDSRIGRAWTAMRDDEDAAAVAGIPIARTKLMAYGTGAALGGIAGAFFAFYLGVVDAGRFEFSFSIFILSMVVLGGLGSIWGVVLGAVVLSVLNGYLLRDFLVDVSDYSAGIYGAILVVTMLLRPEGLVPLNPRRWRRSFPRRSAASGSGLRADIPAPAAARPGMRPPAP